LATATADSTGIKLAQTAFAINRMRELRNAVAHGLDRTVSAGEAQLYVATLEEVVRVLTRPEMVYESRVIAALNEVGASVARSDNGGSVHAVAVTSKGALRIVIRDRGARLGDQDIRRNIAKAMLDGPGGLLIVTNVELSPSARSFNNTESLSGRRPVEAISWNGPHDNGLLARTVLRMSGN
jgi:hypothetical protein